MDFSYPPEAEAFPAELRAWLAENLDERFRAAGAREHGGRGAGVIEQCGDAAHHLERLAEAGFAPEERA